MEADVLDLPQSRCACRILKGCAAWLVFSWGGISGAAEELDYPLSIAVSRSGTIYLADRNLPGVWRLEGDRLSIVFRGSKKFRTPLNAVRCVALDREGNLLAGDSATRDVYRLDDKGTPRPLTSLGKTYGEIRIPMAIVVDADGNLLVSDLETQRIVRVPREGGPVKPFAAVHAPRGLFLDSQKLLWVISGRKLVRFSPQGEPTTIVDDGVFSYPHTVVVGDDGTAYVADGYAKAIWRIPPGQSPQKWVSGPPLDNPVGLALHQGRLFVADPRAKAVYEIEGRGGITRRKAASEH
jgi:sugar lactone lactonase YvrE